MIAAIALLTAAGCSRHGVTLTVNEAGKRVDVMFDGEMFTSYIYPDDLEKPVLYPIYTASGTVVTRGFPLDPRQGERVDHPHHVGLWFNFGDINGLDFWNNSYAVPADRKHAFGSVRHTRIIEASGGGSQGRLVVGANWVDHTGRAILASETSYVFRGASNLRIIDHTVRLTAIDSVTFTDNKEGLIAIRVDRAFEEPSDRPDIFLDARGNPTSVPQMNNDGVNGVYRNSDGLEKGDVWGKPARWVSLSAEKNGQPVSIVIIDHRDNPGYPAHSHARGYGLFATNNMGSRVFDPSAPLFLLKLGPGESVTFRHTIAISNGSFLTGEEIERIGSAE
jgi:hypothetical protein